MLCNSNPAELQLYELLREIIAFLRQQQAVRFGDLATKAEGVLRQFKVTPAPGITTIQDVPVFLIEPDVDHFLHEVEAGLLSVQGAEVLVSRIRRARTSLMASQVRPATH